MTCTVGSSAGAVIRRRLLGCIQGFRLHARLEVSVIPFPAPATSHVACGFPALRAPAHFTASVMGPITEPSSGCIGGWASVSARERPYRNPLYPRITYFYSLFLIYLPTYPARGNVRASVGLRWVTFLGDLHRTHPTFVRPVYLPNQPVDLGAKLKC
jgi:hypothetical protein